MTNQNTISYKQEFVSLLNAFEKQNSFQIYKACSYLKSGDSENRAGKELSKIFMEFVNYLLDHDWFLNVEIFKSQGVLCASKDFSSFQGNAFFDDNGLGMFSLKPDDHSPAKFTQIPEEELQKLPCVLSLVFLTLSARKCAIENGSLKI